jgi:hypothetical protein
MRPTPCVILGAGVKQWKLAKQKNLRMMKTVSVATSGRGNPERRKEMLVN